MKRLAEKLGRAPDFAGFPPKGDAFNQVVASSP